MFGIVNTENMLSWYYI